MIARITWIASLLAVAAVTIAVQLDRQAAMNPELSPLVPEPFRAFAQVHIVTDAATGAQNARALEEARLLVRRRPVPAEHLSLLAIAQSNSGMAQEAGMAIQIAGQRGWRERLAQESVLRLALDAGDRAEAARRYTALLLNQTTPDALLEELGGAVFTEPGGAERQTMVDILAGGERWQTLFLRRGAAVIPPGAFAGIVAESVEHGASYDCAALARAVERIAQRDETAGRLLAEAARDCGGV